MNSRNSINSSVNEFQEINNMIENLNHNIVNNSRSPDLIQEQTFSKLEHKKNDEEEEDQEK